MGDAPAPDSEGGAGLCAGRDAQGDGDVEGRHFDLRAQGGLSDGDALLGDDVVFVALEARVRLKMDDDVQVARSRAGSARVAGAGHAERRAFLHAVRDLHRDGLA